MPRRSALARTSLALAAAIAALAALPNCHGGVSILGIGFGARIGSPHAEEPMGLSTPAVRVDRHAVAIDVDEHLASTATIETERTLLTAAGVLAGQSASMTFDPEFQALDVLEAYSVAPDGTHTEVEEDQILTRPSAATTLAPSFSTTRTTTVLFPQLETGSRTVVRWRLADARSAVFSYVFQPEAVLPHGEISVTISHPAKVALRHGETGGFTAEETVDGDRRVLTARLAGFAGLRPEAAMTSPKDAVPSFAVTTLESWEQLGKMFREAVEPRVVVTPEIQALADRVAGKSTGLDAARALHRWVASNVRYVAVWLEPGATWAPHDAGLVLSRRYGDCKDQYVLLASLLRARGIRCEPALVSWDRAWRVLPVPAPQQFDHCIAYLPELGLWSNPVHPFADLGVLPQELSGKFAVLADEAGGTTRTPEGRTADNAYKVEHDVTIGADGACDGRTTVTVRGRPAMRLRTLLATGLGADAVADDLLARSPEGGFGSIEFSDPLDLDRPLTCRGAWRVVRALSEGPGAFFFVPTGIDFLSPSRAREFLSASERRLPIVVGAVEVAWRHTIRAPRPVRDGRVPKGRSVENSVGRFASRYSIGEGGVLVVERDLAIAKDVIAPEEYALLREVLEAAVADARTPILLAD